MQRHQQLTAPLSVFPPASHNHCMSPAKSSLVALMNSTPLAAAVPAGAFLPAAAGAAERQLLHRSALTHAVLADLYSAPAAVGAGGEHLLQPVAGLTPGPVAEQAMSGVRHAAAACNLLGFSMTGL